ncbi:hypothetical protein HOLleu_01684 [Holothuria leucospilota]|uniref:CCHC-type domain-containing protein n=1 Tax=Holothuria leucospilota TaxID=206669 RepID=A0A9Q1HKZ7_HOLLE|nr:hypothetical protein HOLleu_01684 [Holothuria leucospilota]
MRWCKYGSGELAGIFNGKRQCRMELDRDIPSFLFIGGSKAHIRYFGQPRTCFKCGQEGHEARSCPNRRCGRCLQVGHDKAECPNEVRSYSAHASADVEQAPEPSQAGPEYSTQELEAAAQEVEQDFLASKQCEGGTAAPKANSSPSSPPTPVEADRMAVEEDLQLSSDSESAMSDGGEPASEPPPKDPPSGEGWFDLCEGEEPSLKRSASGGVLDRGVHHSEDPTPSSQRDFNCVPDTQLDRMSTCTSSGCGVGTSELDMFVKNHDMVDVWRAQHPGLSVFTWHRPDGTDASRLDRVYSPPALSPSDCEVVTCPISDHDAVTVSFQPPESWPTGRGFWKMNTDILTEADYSEQFEARYEGWRTLRPAFSTDLEWWDDVKSRIKQFTVEYCVARARRKREEFLSLCSRERKGDTSALHAIQQYLDQKLRGARVRARVHCVEAEEKPTIKFYRVSVRAGRVTVNL